MPYTKKTLSDLKQLLADKIAAGIVPTSSATLSYWTRQLNAGMAFCADTIKFVKSTTLTTSSGTIALPDDFATVDKVTDSDGNELTQISKEDSGTAAGKVFWITGTHFDGFYLNAPTDEAFTVFYIYRPVEMSSDSDICIIADPLAVVCYAYSKLRMAQTDPLGDAEKEMGECIRRTEELVMDIIKNDEGGMHFKLQDGI